MCDYSLENHVSRPAEVGDKLVTTAFHQSTTRGFCDIEKNHVAVCLLPGTELAFDAPVSEEGFLGFYYKVKNPGILTARFRHINLDRPNAHHDALEFADGRIVLLTRLRDGQRATVLQLPANPAWTGRTVVYDESTEPEFAI